MPKAIVTVTIQPFVDPFVSPATPPKLMQPYDMADTFDPARRIVVTRPSGTDSAQGGAGPYVPGSIAVKGTGNIDLTFHVVDSAASPGQYIVCGLVFSKITEAFRALALPLPPGSGRDIFTEFTCDSVGDLTVHDAKTASANYHFLLLIQNMAGGIGIIDPQISNQ